jgi:hypothetical protein
VFYSNDCLNLLRLVTIIRVAVRVLGVTDCLVMSDRVSHLGISGCSEYCYRSIKDKVETESRSQSDYDGEDNRFRIWDHLLPFLETDSNL